VSVVVIAASEGGVKAVGDVLSSLPADFPATLLVVQHRSPGVPGLLDTILAQRTALQVKEAEGGESIHTGVVYLAPADHHLLLDPDGILRLSQSAKAKHVRPAADVLFESVASNHKGRVVALVLTGRLRDGSAGVEAVTRAGGYVIVQDPQTARAPSMPASALITGAVDQVLPLPEIGPALVKLLADGGGSEAGMPRAWLTF
jgi:two-component system chemotaxis response regulator CheB